MDPQLVSMLIVPLPLWAMVLMIGMPLVTILIVLAAWIYVLRMMGTYHQETSKTLSDITAIAQTIAAQNRDVLRRLEP
jgi:type III secretory pathway component EscV